MKPYRIVLASLVVGAATTQAIAQTCAAPIAIASGNTFTGNTCNDTPQLPFLANGAIGSQGNQTVYSIAAHSNIHATFTLTPEAAADLALYVCGSPCSTYSSCVAAMDDGGAGVPESASLDLRPGNYFVVVGATGPVCGSYSLSVAIPVGAPR